jgi:DNA mismatch repair protein MutL
MGKIKQLSQEQAQKIAAGEVVDRPVNVVKELIENALDAQSTVITLYIEDGGHQLIRIVDNGCGMDKEDALLCFNQHATSKISSVEELTYIHTFGFRGEALASISAVSNVTLITKQHTDEFGYSINRTNQSQTITECACPSGTDISIKDLFYNVPARKKFLKKSETEWRQITYLFQAFCFQHPSVHFKLYHDGKLVHNCPPVSATRERVEQLWNNYTSPHIVEIPEYSGNEFSFSGIITNHHYHRYDRNQIFIFVNNRWIKNPDIVKALLKGYNNVLPPGKYPAASIAITVNPEQVDINIHPRKEEVQFLHPRRIETALTQSVTQALETHLTTQTRISSPGISERNDELTTPYFTQKTKEENRFTSQFNARDFDKPFIFTSKNSTTSQSLPWEKNTTDSSTRPFRSLSEDGSFFKEMPDEQTNAFAMPTHEQSFESLSLVGQLHSTYLLLQHPDGLYIIDQHAAHERILYERLKEQFGNCETIPLLFPVVIHLNETDCKLIEQYFDFFAQHGIQLELSGPNQISVCATPIHIKHIDFTELIKTVVSWIHESSETHDALFKMLHEKLRAQMACKGAVKAGDNLTIEQMKTLLHDLNTVDNRFSCPHGRPTGWLFHTNEIERKFKRRT